MRAQRGRGGWWNLSERGEYPSDEDPDVPPQNLETVDSGRVIEWMRGGVQMSTMYVGGTLGAWVYLVRLRRKERHRHGRRRDARPIAG